MACHTRWILILALLATSFAPAHAQFAFPNSGMAVTSGPHLDLDWAEQRAFRQQLRELAGKDAVDCGLARVDQDPAFRTDCALAAFAAGRPFYVLYESPVFWRGQGGPWTGVVFEGFVAQNADRVFLLNYPDGFWPLQSWFRVGWGTKKLMDFTATICRTPVTLQKTPHGDLTCSFSPPAGANQFHGSDIRFVRFWGPLAPAVIK
jgi:hypothetical protein